MKIQPIGIQSFSQIASDYRYSKMLSKLVNQMPEIDLAKNTQNLSRMYNNIPIQDILPGVVTNNIPGFPGVPKTSSLIETMVKDFLSVIYELRDNYVQYQVSMLKGEARETNEYGKYLQFPNQDIRELAASIVSRTDSNDDKMQKIEAWVYENIPYQYDIINYKKAEYWAVPTDTLKKGSGDCEDHAFLIHSLALNSGVPWDRLRTYGGIVTYTDDDGRFRAGGHGWTTYKREVDNEWVVLDTTFFVDTEEPINQRITLSDDSNYYDDYFFVNYQNTVDTPYSNGIRNPEVHDGYRGLAINRYA